LIAATARGKGALDDTTWSAAQAHSIWQGSAGAPRIIQIPFPQGDARVRGWPLLYSEQTKELWLVPIAVGSGTAAMIGIDYHRRATFALEQIELAHVLALQLSLFLQIFRMAKRERAGAITDERNRMAQEIHDSLAQGLTGITIQLNAAQARMTGNPGAAETHIASARDLARTCLSEARRSVWALRPQALEQGTLVTALARVVDQFSSGENSHISFAVKGETRLLPPSIELNILRIAQEAITNAVRHSQGDRISVRLEYDRVDVRLEVEDDGSGDIARTKPASGDGLGLPGMESRAQTIGGRLCLRSKPGEGTLLTLTVPSS
jgi:signal transduction histidine kinase